MLELLKEYYVFMLIILVISYLVPKKEYKSYIHFFVGIFVVVLFLRPVLDLFSSENSSTVLEVFKKINTQIEHIEIEMEEENIFEYFFFEGEGE